MDKWPDNGIFTGILCIWQEIATKSEMFFGRRRRQIVWRCRMGKKVVVLNSNKINSVNWDKLDYYNLNYYEVFNELRKKQDQWLSEGYNEFPHIKKDQLNQWLHEEKKRVSDYYSGIVELDTAGAALELEKNGKTSNIIAVACYCLHLFTLYFFKNVGFYFKLFWIVILGPAIAFIIRYIIRNAAIKQIKTDYPSNSKRQEACNCALSTVENAVTNQITNYYNGFFERVDNAKTKLTKSGPTVAISKDLLDYGFGPIIKATDRRPSLERIEVPYSFNVYIDRVSFDSIKDGTIVKGGSYYSFNERRIEDLHGPVEQTALAQAIAANIILLAAEKYGTDLSGTSSMVKVNYAYGSDFVRANLTYLAPNGNFIAKQSW